MQNKTEFILVKKEIETDDVTSLFFKTSDGAKYDFKAGQYVDIRPPSISGHGKSYTISSAPSDELVRITIKRQGAVSSAIIDMTVGEKIDFEGPYGVFYPEDDVKDVVMLAAGIGITPFFSVIKDCYENKKSIDITLIYSNKTKVGITFAKDLKDIKIDNPSFKIVHCITQEKTSCPCIAENTRIDGDIIKKHITNHKDKCYYICGSISFVRDMWNTLKSIGIVEENIYTEAFY